MPSVPPAVYLIALEARAAGAYGNAILSCKWYLWRLRSKIEKDPGNPRFIVTERGIGYRFALL